MRTATVEVELERFQLIPTGAGPTLLRVAARWRAETEVELDPPVLVIDDDGVQRIFEALPGPRAAPPTASPEAPRWQAGFSVPADLLARRISFALDAGAAGIIGLPAPIEADTGLPHAPLAGDERVAALERRLAAERHARREVEFEAETHADADVAAQSVAAAARADADAARQRLVAVEAQLQEEQRLRRAAEDRAARAEREHAGLTEAQARELADARRLAETRAAAAREARAAAEARAAEAERALEAAMAKRD